MNILKRIFKRTKDGLLDMLYPKHIKCIFCDNEINELNLYDSCEDCLKNLPRIEKDYCLHCGMPRKSGASGVCLFCKRDNLNFTVARAIFSYEGNVRKVIQKFKYENGKYLYEPLSYYLYDYVKRSNWKFDLITFVPIHAKKLKKRGYNQAELLASELAKKLNIPCVNLFEKLTDAKTQTKLSRQDRKKNIENTFKLINKDIKDKNILLIDDVFTTGATSDELSKLMKNAHASYIYVLTLAHTILKEVI